jgi:hypothetical protein
VGSFFTLGWLLGAALFAGLAKGAVFDSFPKALLVLHASTADFVRAVPEDKWDFTPDPPGKFGRAPAPHRIGEGFAPFCSNCGTSSVCAVSTMPRW